MTIIGNTLAHTQSAQLQTHPPQGVTLTQSVHTTRTHTQSTGGVPLTQSVGSPPQNNSSTRIEIAMSPQLGAQQVYGQNTQVQVNNQQGYGQQVGYDPNYAVQGTQIQQGYGQQVNPPQYDYGVQVNNQQGYVQQNQGTQVQQGYGQIGRAHV